MIDPGDSLSNGRDGRTVLKLWPSQQQHWNSERPGRGNLAVSGPAPAVLCHDGIDGVGHQQRAVVAFGKRSARQNVTRVRHLEWRLDRIDAPNEIVMLRGRVEGRELLPADGQEHASWFLTQLPHGVACIGHLDPVVPLYRDPGVPSQGQKRSAGPRRSLHRIGGDDLCVRVGSVEQRVDMLKAQVIGKALCSSESATSYRDGLGGRGCRTAGERQGRSEIIPSGKCERELAGLRRSTENKDLRSHVGN